MHAQFVEGNLAGSGQWCDNQWESLLWGNSSGENTPSSRPNPFSPLCCRILSLEKLGVIFNQVATPLQFTPRKLAVHPSTGNLVLLETDHNTFTEATKAQRKQLMAEVCCVCTQPCLIDVLVHKLQQAFCPA